MPVPVLFGLRRVQPILIEFSSRQGPTGSGFFRAYFLAWTEGLADSNSGALPYYVDGVYGVDSVVSGEKVFGIFTRTGGPGVNDNETSAEYVSDPTTQARAQNIDWQSPAGVAYSELAYVIFRAAFGRADATLSIPTVEIEGKGIKTVSYAANGTPDAAAWSNSPIWQAVLLALSPKFGLGLLTTDIDYAVAKDSADYASPIITSTEAVTTVTISRGPRPPPAVAKHGVETWPAPA